MTLEAGYALGGATGPDVFLEGAGLLDAVHEAKRIYPRHTPVMFDGDLETTLAGDRGAEERAAVPNLDPMRMPELALKSAALPYMTYSDVMGIELREAHERLYPYFHRKYIGGARKGQFTMGYETPRAMVTHFLTTNAKLSKAVKGLPGVKPGLSRGPAVLPHHLLSDLSRKKLPRLGPLGFCVGSNEACRSTCLVYSGQNPLADAETPVKLSRSEALVREPEAWVRMYVESIRWHAEWCRERKLLPYVRPNVLSDIPWELVAPLIFDDGTTGDVVFYDYTKVPGRTAYDLTFSFSGTNEVFAEHELRHGHRVAVVFWLPKPCRAAQREGYYAAGTPKVDWTCDTPDKITFWDLPVIDGDAHDFRPLDPRGAIVGLTYKPPLREGKRQTTPPDKFVVKVFRDRDTGALIVPGTPAQLGAEDVFNEAAPTELTEVA